MKTAHLPGLIYAQTIHAPKFSMNRKQGHSRCGTILVMRRMGDYRHREVWQLHHEIHQICKPRAVCIPAYGFAPLSPSSCTYAEAFATAKALCERGQRKRKASAAGESYSKIDAGRFEPFGFTYGKFENQMQFVSFSHFTLSIPWAI